MTYLNPNLSDEYYNLIWYSPSPNKSKEKAKKKGEKTALIPSHDRFLCCVISIYFFSLFSLLFPLEIWKGPKGCCLFAANRQPVLTRLAPLHLFFQRNHLFSLYSKKKYK
jgi:hypothetical protein